VVCPLTGGWDSRLLACLLAERGLLEQACTVNTGLGDDRDERFAAAVAARLAVPHTVVGAPANDYGAELERAIRAVEHQSLPHLILHRLVAGMPPGGIWADGIGGDVLIKGLLVNAEILAADRPREALFDLSISPRKRLTAIFQPRARRRLRGLARDAFLRDTERFDGHPAAASLSLYWTRTHRTIALSPARVFGAQHPVLTPFVADAPASVALAVDPEEKLGGRIPPSRRGLPPTTRPPSGRWASRCMPPPRRAARTSRSSRAARCVRGSRRRSSTRSRAGSSGFATRVRPTSPGSRPPAASPSGASATATWWAGPTRPSSSARPTASSSRSSTG
jgi:hypothetical protein